MPLVRRSLSRLEYPHDFAKENINYLRVVNLHACRKHFTFSNLRVQVLVRDRAGQSVEHAACWF